MNVEESPGGIIPGMERKLRIVRSSVFLVYLHVQERTSFALTKLESNRDE